MLVVSGMQGGCQRSPTEKVDLEHRPRGRREEPASAKAQEWVLVKSREQSPDTLKLVQVSLSVSCEGYKTVCLHWVHIQ